MINAGLVAQIKACKGVYSLGATARHFNVSKGTVHNVWHGRTHTAVPEAPEPPNVISPRVSPEIIYEDGRTLLERGLSVSAAAAAVGVSRNTFVNYMREEAPLLLVG